MINGDKLWEFILEETKKICEKKMNEPDSVTGIFNVTAIEPVPQSVGIDPPDSPVVGLDLDGEGEKGDIVTQILGPGQKVAEVISQKGVRND